MPGRMGICLWIMVLAGLTGGAVGLRSGFASLLGLDETAGGTCLLAGTMLYWIIAAGVSAGHCVKQTGACPRGVGAWGGNCAGRLGLLVLTLPAALAILARSFPLPWPVIGLQLLWLGVWLFFFFTLAHLLGRWYFPALLAGGAVLHLGVWFSEQLFLMREGVRMPVAGWQEWMPLSVLKNGGPAQGKGWLLAGGLILCGSVAVWIAGRKPPAA